MADIAVFSVQNELSVLQRGFCTISHCVLEDIYFPDVGIGFGRSGLTSRIVSILIAQLDFVWVAVPAMTALLLTVAE